ncbi:MAG: DUF2029 domain-containing protein [Candidatus Sumerlaeaceae bacterium]|nr:DUF2029 domain-containing protein [Candidatus Sumerlaeaceae bacterium]
MGSNPTPTANLYFPFPNRLASVCIPPFSNQSPEFTPISQRAIYWTTVSLLLVIWTAGLAWYTRCGPSNPKMDAISWIAAGVMLREGRPVADIYAIRTEQVVIEVDQAPGRIAGPKELTLTRVLPGAAIAEVAQRLGYSDANPPAFVYPPGAALAGKLLSRLGWPLSTIFMDSIGLLFLGIAIALVLARVHGETPNSALWFAAILAIAIAFHPLRFSLFLGQVTPLLALGWLLPFLPQNRRGEIIAGTIIGLLASLKVFPLLLILWLLLRRQWLGCIVAIIVFMCGCFALGWNAFISWTAAASQMSAPIRVWAENQSLAATLHRFIYPIGLARDWVIVEPAAPWWLSSLPGVALLAWWAKRARGTAHSPGLPPLALFAALWILPVALLGLFWTHYIVLLIPVIPIVLANRKQTGMRQALALASLFLLAISGDTWTSLMPFLEQTLGNAPSAFLMRGLIALPALSILTLLCLLLTPPAAARSAPGTTPGPPQNSC